MSESLLEGVRVVDLAGEPAAITGRVLADLGADVVLVEPPEGAALRAIPNRFRAWSAGKRSVQVSGGDDPALDELLARGRRRHRHARVPRRVGARPGTLRPMPSG